ncbi:hypothetical protein [Erythrobacter aurantius]|uniref:hypothetical protein n=1 Tax=Erythrobacter aurantius TaxID=2909249 RepID=UPI002079779F|nr:hypothetical protein [Erythrobacter aurantius]
MAKMCRPALFRLQCHNLAIIWGGEVGGQKPTLVCVRIIGPRANHSLNKDFILCVRSFLLLQSPPRLWASLLAVKPLIPLLKPVTQWLPTLSRSPKTRPRPLKKAQKPLKALLLKAQKLLKLVQKLLATPLKLLLLKLKPWWKASNSLSVIAIRL